MTRVKPKFRPGVGKTDTKLQYEGGYIDSNLGRWYQGQFQPIGGWTLFSPETYDGRARGGHSWSNLQGQNCIAFGTEQGLYGIVAGSRRNITPKLHFGVLTNVFTTVNASPIVTVAVPYHNLSAGDFVTFSNHQTTVGGLTIEGTYAILDVPTAGTFRITHGSNATSTVATAAGGNVDFTADLPLGLVDNAITGYGTGTYGSGPYGTSAPTAELRVWSLDNFGENLVANPSGYGLFEWQPETNYEDLVANGTFASSAGWATGTGWSIGSGVATKTAGTAANLSQNFLGFVEGGRTYIAQFTITRTAGTIKLRANAGDPAAVIDMGDVSSAITKSGTYRRIFRAPADTLDILFEADATFAGTVDNVSITLCDIAYAIPTAPARMDAMFVDSHGVVVGVGCLDLDGIYNPNCVRNSDISNNRLWIPDTDNVCSSIVLRGGGGRLMAGCATRQQSLVWGDNGVFSLQWVGEPGGAFDDNLLATNCGLLSRHSFAKANGFVIFVTNTSDYFIFRGIGSTSLGIPEKIESPIRADTFDNIDKRQSLKAHGGLNPTWTEFWFFYPDTRDFEENAPAECSRVVAYNWVDNVWMPHNIARTTWIANGILPDPLGFEPRANNKGLIHRHEIGDTANGALRATYFETADLDQADGENFSALMGIEPDIKDQVGNIEFTVYSKLNAQSGTEITTGPFPAGPGKGMIPFRVNARMFRVRCDYVTTGGKGRFGAWTFDLFTIPDRR